MRIDSDMTTTDGPAQTPTPQVRFQARFRVWQSVFNWCRSALGFSALGYLVLSFLVLGNLVLCTGCGEPSPKASMPANPAGIIPKMHKPDILTASEVDLDGEEPVIGVSVGDHHRAYAVRAFSVNPVAATSTTRSQNTADQVVNDLIADKPITVTYFVAGKSCRVLSASTQSPPSPLEIEVIGTDNGAMLLEWSHQQFPQTNPPSPLVDHPFKLTTWNEWKAEHPTSDVYLGSLTDD